MPHAKTIAAKAYEKYMKSNTPEAAGTRPDFSEQTGLLPETWWLSLWRQFFE